MSEQTAHAPVKWGKVIDHTKCIGCHACTTACKSENDVPVGVTRTYVKSVDVGVFPEARRAFQVTRCNQCEDAPCVAACPTTAMHKRPDGIVDFDKSICIGCKACMAACPYDAIFINPADHSAEKCNFCAHRLDMGLEPACVTVCPTEAILVGDMNDTNSKVAAMVNRHPVAVRKPEKDTRPKLYYKGAHQATLDPLAARQPDGGLFMWSQQQTGGQYVVSGTPADIAPHAGKGHAASSGNSSAAALLSYDVAHKAPWDYRVSLYTWTKGISAGAYLVPMLMLVFGALSTGSDLWLWAVPVVAGAFLGITGALLLWDLEHPERFYLIFTKFHWRSWLVKGSVIITAYSAVLVAHFAASVIGPEWAGVREWLMFAGLPLALLTAVYTAYLFAQAKARDLWQSPLLPPHMAVQSGLLGAAVMLPLALAIGEPDAVVNVLAWVLGVTSLLHVLFVVGEITLAHPTAHARLAAHTMTHGRYAKFFWPGLLLTTLAIFAPWLGALAAFPALLGLLAHEHAYVQAGQSVPLA